MMRKTASLEIYDYWNGLRNGNTVPDRTQIEPSALSRLLPDLFILGKGEKGAPYFRLAGTRLCSLFCRELRNQPFSSLWLQAEDDEPVGYAQMAMQRETPVMLDARCFLQNGISRRCEILLLPLRSPGVSGAGETDRLLGSIIMEGHNASIELSGAAGLAIERGGMIGSRESIDNVDVKPVDLGAVTAGKALFSAIRQFRRPNRC